nr:hypothetical protein [uncultured Ralstonia sp.]
MEITKARFKQIKIEAVPLVSTSVKMHPDGTGAAPKKIVVTREGREVRSLEAAWPTR